MVRAGLIATVLVLAVGPTEARAQYCIGSTAYTVRDETGAPMGASEFRRLEVVSVNGEPARRKSSGGEVYYEAARSKPNRQPYRIALGRPLELATMAQCGEIGELVLRYRSEVMRLRFDVEHHNTRYHIEALPFKAGTFRLIDRSRGGQVFPCAGGGNPPLIDNENRGVCRVPARLWKRVATPKTRAPGSAPGPTRSRP